MKIVITSLNNNISLKKEIFDLSNSLENEKCKPEIYLGKKIIFKLFLLKKNDELIIYNTSILNFYPIFLSKILGFNVSMVFHEPIKFLSELKYYPKTEVIKYLILNFIHLIFFVLVNRIILLSN